MLQPLRRTNLKMLGQVGAVVNAPLQSLAPQSLAGGASVNGANVDFNGQPLPVAAIYDLGAINAPAANATFHTQESADGIGGWADLAGMTTAALAVANQTVMVRGTRSLRYLRVVVDAGGAGGTVLAAGDVAPDFTTGLGTAYCGLYTTAVALTDVTALSQLTEATFPGYARVPITWHTPGLNVASIPTMLGSLAFFAPSGVVNPSQSAYGYFVVDAAAAGNLLYAEALGQPFRFDGVLNQLELTPRYQLPTDQVYGSANVVL
jgi:hypothetical protein